jgi:hypothetical protein
MVTGSFIFQRFWLQSWAMPASSRQSWQHRHGKSCRGSPSDSKHGSSVSAAAGAHRLAAEAVAELITDPMCVLSTCSECVHTIVTVTVIGMAKLCNPQGSQRLAIDTRVRSRWGSEFTTHQHVQIHPCTSTASCLQRARTLTASSKSTNSKVNADVPITPCEQTQRGRQDQLSPSMCGPAEQL